ncbi:type II CAAX prenyl endopeptidase Rce1 family protein, partial [Eggerthella sinensis]|uniref:CPBP family glutamic-type intramembrane protease n=1 Tax=Eggerthella sinensis TaxID=242230 RepID=UPI0022E12563
MRSLPRSRRATAALAAAAVSSVLFGALHVSLGDSASAVGAVAVAQTILKPVQAALFGFFMAALYVAARNLWQLAAVHAAFNLAYTGPLLLMGGFQPNLRHRRPARPRPPRRTGPLLLMGGFQPNLRHRRPARPRPPRRNHAAAHPARPSR